MSENTLLELLSSLPTGLLSMLPSLITGAPELLQQYLNKQAEEGDMPPIAAQMLGGIATEIYGEIIDWATGTSDSTVRASDYLGNSTTRSRMLRQRARAYRAMTTGTLLDQRLAESAEQDVEAFFASWYSDLPEDQRAEQIAGAKDSVWGKLLASAGRQIRDEISRTSRSIVAEIYGDPADVNTADARALYEQVGGRINQLLYERGARYGAGSLSAADVREIAMEFARANREDLASTDTRTAALERMERHIEHVAQGIDNVRDAIGRNTTVQQARAHMAAIYGSDFSITSAETFAALSQNLKGMFGGLGVTTEIGRAHV